ncbi:hypothetical protein OCAR_6139 [Afipia carboxidovorans OM5]|nr:hypothetical protein OCAR_6139 [Afipia carboxidovorans OM5]
MADDKWRLLLCKHLALYFRKKLPSSIEGAANQRKKFW